MPELLLIGAWAEFAVRWLHVVTAIAWIGSSFYFIALDLGLRKSNDRRQNVHGEEWQVHGGGFYHIQKYLVAPDRLPDDLIWFKWESYATWLSGFALLVLVYYLGAELYLIDPNVADLPVWAAVAISVGSLAFGWVAYDLLCKSPVGRDPTRLMLVLFGLLVAMSWVYTQVFSGRAALLHLGAFTATIMSANVFLIIIPNQKIVVADLKAHRSPDPKYGVIAKQRSTHNNYLTLPVLFLMLSNHYPLAFASQWNWLIGSLVFLMGVTIRHFFNTMHAKKGMPWWTWGATAAIFVAIMALSTAPLYYRSGTFDTEVADLTGRAGMFAASSGFDEVADIVLGRCSMCHGAEPGWQGISAAPGGVRLDTPASVAIHAQEVFLQSGVTHAMPPGNVTWMEPAERQAIVEWFRAAGR